MSRSLAHVEKIVKLFPIPGADKIEAAQVLGWEVVVKKGEFKEGDLVVYYEIDAFLNGSDPRYASFEDRFTNWGDKRGMRLKTIRLRKQLSQGLVLGLDQFPEIINPTEGLDVTDVLKIEKWEAPEETRSNAGGGNSSGGKPFPSFLRKTDQERIQNCFGHVTRLVASGDNKVEVTIKRDGSSMTIFVLDKKSKYYEEAFKRKQAKIKGGRWNRVLVLWQKIKEKLGLVEKPDYIASVCSRNIELKDDDGSHFWETVKRDQIIEKMISTGHFNIAIQGELTGPTIQKNYEKVDDFVFEVYDVFDIEKQEYVSPDMARQITATCGLKYVPVVDPEFDLSTFIGEDGVIDVKAMLKSVENKNAKGVDEEGRVYKFYNKNGDSFKVVSNVYLMKKG